MPRRRRYYSDNDFPLPFVVRAILAVVALLPALLVTATVGVFAVEKFAEAIPGLSGSGANVIAVKQGGLGIFLLLSLSLSVDLYRLLKSMVNKSVNAL